MSDLRSIGITREQEELFLRVKKAVGNYPGLENDLKNNPDKIYFACKRSGLFTESELEFLGSTFRTSTTQRLLQKIKRLLGL